MASHFSWELIPLMIQNKILVYLLLSIKTKENKSRASFDSLGIKQISVSMIKKAQVAYMDKHACYRTVEQLPRRTKELNNKGRDKKVHRHIMIKQVT